MLRTEESAGVDDEIDDAMMLFLDGVFDVVAVDVAVVGTIGWLIVVDFIDIRVVLLLF